MSANASAQIRNASRISAMPSVFSETASSASDSGISTRTSSASPSKPRVVKPVDAVLVPAELDVAVVERYRLAVGRRRACRRASGRAARDQRLQAGHAADQVRVLVRRWWRYRTISPAGSPSRRRPAEPRRREPRRRAPASIGSGRPAASSRTPDGARRGRRAASSRCSSSCGSPVADRGGERLVVGRERLRDRRRALARVAVDLARPRVCACSSRASVLPSSELRTIRIPTIATREHRAGSPGG